MIIVVAGGKQHGKDTFAELLQKQFPELNFQRKAFADKMKEITACLLDCEYSEIEELKVQEDIQITDKSVIRQGTTMRRFLQTLGQIMKDLTSDDLIWTKLLLDEMTDPLTNYVITDCRFPFEAEGLREHAKILRTDIVVVKVYNPRVELGKDTHPSETQFDDIEFDQVIFNQGSLEDFDVKIGQLVKEFQNGL